MLRKDVLLRLIYGFVCLHNLGINKKVIFKDLDFKSDSDEDIEVQETTGQTNAGHKHPDAFHYFISSQFQY